MASARQLAEILNTNQRQIHRWRARGLNCEDPIELLRDLGQQKHAGATFYSLTSDPDRVAEILDQLETDNL